MQAWGSSWLNIIGKALLIKAVLNSLPLFQFFVLLALVGILKKMEDLIRKFFWKGGKQNENKIPLVKWEIVSKPLQEGGLNFKNLCAQNLAMGAKLIWRIIAPNPGWAHLALWKKYFKGRHLHYLDKPKSKFKSPFSIISIKAAPLVNARAYWIPGNGQSNNLWEDRILSRPLLAETRSLHSLWTWMMDAHIKSLWDMSCWIGHRWVGWKQLPVPPALQSDCT